MIPKIIHYCWFGNGEKPDNTIKYIDSWKKILPDYEFIEWNESNFDVDSSIPYVQEAYKAKKFAFVSDYVRLYALKTFGGVYLDTDVEIVKPFEGLFQNYKLITGFETLNTLITAFIACDKGNEIIAEFLSRYDKFKFIKEDGSLDMTPINNRFTDLLVEHGLLINNKKQTLCNNSVLIMPYEVFTGYDIENSHPKVTDDTYTIHHFQSSWKKMTIREIIEYKIVVPMIQKIIGYDRYDALKKKLKGN